jgi:hypothetical protein
MGATSHVYPGSAIWLAGQAAAWCYVMRCKAGPTMNRSLALVSIVVACLLGNATVQAEPIDKACVFIKVSSPYAGAGYNHVATAENQCNSVVRCELWTDVDPQPRHLLELQPQATKDITFRREAPGYGFRAYYRCGLK